MTNRTGLSKRGHPACSCSVRWRPLLRFECFALRQIQSTGAEGLLPCPEGSSTPPTPHTGIAGDAVPGGYEGNLYRDVAAEPQDFHLCLDELLDLRLDKPQDLHLALVFVEVGAGATAYSPTRWRRRAALGARSLGRDRVWTATAAAMVGARRRPGGELHMCELDGNHETSLPAFLSAHGDFTLMSDTNLVLKLTAVHMPLQPLVVAPHLGCSWLGGALHCYRFQRSWLQGVALRRRAAATPTPGDAPSTFNHTATAPKIFHLCILSFKVVHTNPLMSSCNLQIQAHDRLQGEDLHEPGITIRKCFLVSN